MMVSEFSAFAITGYINTMTPPKLAGSIASFLYWHEGLSSWTLLSDTPPTLPRGTALHLAVQWASLSSERISGHIDLTVTKPDGSVTTLSSVLNQDRWADPQNTWAVQFEPIILEESGGYQAEARLSTMGEVLDQKTVACAIVPAAARFYMPGRLDVKVTDGTYLDMYWRCAYSCVITNKGDAPGTHTIRWQHYYDGTAFGSERSLQITLEPGQSYQWSHWVYIRLNLVNYGICKLWGDWEEDNYSEGISTRDLSEPR